MTLDEFLTKLKAKGLTWFITCSGCIRTKIKVGESEREACPIDIVKGWDGKQSLQELGWFRWHLDGTVGFTAYEVIDAADDTPGYATIPGIRHLLLEACGLKGA